MKLIVMAGAVAILGSVRPCSATPPLFPASNPWNQRITDAPVSAASNAIINGIVATFGNGRLHPDFGQDSSSSSALYGIPYNSVHGNATPRVSVMIDAYASQSDIVAAPIPPNAVLEGDRQNGPLAGVNNRGDSHLIIWDQDNNIAYEFYRASRPSENSDGRWHANAEAVWDLNVNSFRALGWTSADAAGLPILPGLARPDEGLPVSQGGQGVIRHAIRFTLTNSVILNRFIYPASHVANPGNLNTAVQPPMGSRFRLKASADISTLNPQSRVIAQAMRDYGMILADNGSNFFFTGASYSPDANNQFALTWSDNDIQDTVHGLKSLHFADFEVVDLAPILTGLSNVQGVAGSSVTIVGQNFSGAAGRVQALFGGVPAGSTVVVDDSHIVAIAPAGVGTVDVRVQSGVADPGDAQNVNSPIFGYGLSAISAADRFTFLAATGVCCRGATCAVIAQSACVVGSAHAGGSFASGAACNTSNVTNSPCCYADYNKSGGISVQDIFDYLGDWFASSPFAATGGDGLAGNPSVQHIFDFLNAWFAGC